MADFVNKYPYTDFHELNLDWTLETVKATKEAVDQNTAEIEQFTEDITEQQETFEHDMTEWKNGVDGDLAQWKHDTEEDIGEWETTTAGTFQGQINDMNDDWDQFLADYQQQGPVTQDPYGDNVLEVTSQNAVNIALRGFNGIDNILFGCTPVYNKKYDGATPSTNTAMSYFPVEMTTGTTYYFDPAVRIISNGSVNVAERVLSYTAASTGTYYCTFENAKEWRMSTSSDLSKVCGFKSTSFSANQLKQTGGASDKEPMSQKATMDAIGGYYGRNNMLMAAEVHYNEYKRTASPVSNTNYTWFEIYLTAGTYYFDDEARFVIPANSSIGLVEHATSYTAASDGFYDITFANLNKWKMSTSSDFSKIPDYKTPSYISPLLAQSAGTDPDVPMSQKAVTDALQAAGAGGMLYGKKWYALGDSFTHGDFTGTSGYTFDNAPYMGQNKVYPFYIGRRCGMDIVNLAVNGMSLADYTGATDVLSNGTYQNVGADADYITIKIGVNDSHQNIPIGTINDNVNTTFYGAFNIVMNWLITNRPLARIGIIVTNGLDDGSYATATIAIAEKYGVPYLNEWDGVQVPVLCRSGRTDVDPTIISARTATYRVSSSNGHPNVYAHERESEFVEEWLKTI